ncbi:transposase HI [Brachionus plicatilis]|uniref:Transposase HI n=1 Tax=Brachionus plicatilis TaxID=10195 RepID=A0A3M7SUC2_BRAPC|nr:transposase HI [Brachionus plicatilis]
MKQTDLEISNFADTITTASIRANMNCRFVINKVVHNVTLNKPIELYNLKEVIDLNQADILEWLKFKGVFPSTKNCSKCGKSMKFVQRNDSIDGFSWRCTTDSKRCSLRDGTYLQNSRIDLKTFLKIVYFWSFQPPLESSPPLDEFLPYPRYNLKLTCTFLLLNSSFPYWNSRRTKCISHN